MGTDPLTGPENRGQIGRQQEPPPPRTSHPPQAGTPPDNPASSSGRQAALLARVAKLVCGRTDTDTVLDRITEEAADLVGASRAAVFLLNSEHRPRYVTGFGLSDEFIDQIEPALAGQTALLSAQQLISPLVVEDARHQPPAIKSLHRLMLANGVITMVCLPLIYHGNLLGLLTLYHDARYTYGKDDTNTLLALTGFMTLAVVTDHTSQARREEHRHQDRFFSLLSHELRTPLTSIVGFAQLIKKKLTSMPPADPRLVEHTNILWVQAQRLSRLIDTFVDLAHIERGEFALNHGKVELVTLLKNAIEQACSISRTSVQLVVNLPDHQLWVHGDSKRLERVFIHVISNAIQYSPSGMPVEVLCHHNSEQGKVLVQVTDKGPGIPPDRLAHIFDRSDYKDPLGAGGLGLGLYISKIIIEAHGGHISIDSSPKYGTTVLITLPV